MTYNSLFANIAAIMALCPLTRANYKKKQRKSNINSEKTPIKYIKKTKKRKIERKKKRKKEKDNETITQMLTFLKIVQDWDDDCFRHRPQL